MILLEIYTQTKMLCSDSYCTHDTISRLAFNLAFYLDNALLVFSLAVGLIRVQQAACKVYIQRTFRPKQPRPLPTSVPRHTKTKLRHTVCFG